MHVCTSIKRVYFFTSETIYVCSLCLKKKDLVFTNMPCRTRKYELNSQSILIIKDYVVIGWLITCLSFL